MREEIKKRIEAVRSGKMPEGYKKVHPYTIPESWKVEKLGVITKRTSRPNKDGQDRQAYSINNRKGFVPQSEQFEEGSYQDLDKSAYKIVRKGEFAYNPARVNVGSIGRLRDEDEVIVSSLYVCVSVDERVDGEYFDAWTKSRDFFKETVRNTEGSVREYLFYENFANMRMPLPSLTEQQKIAEILAACDRMIELKQQLLEEKRRQKKWLMQKLLDPNSGVRLPGYTALWKLCTLGNIMNITSVKRIHQSDWTDNGVRFLRARDIVAAFNDEEPEDYLFISKDKYDEYSAISGKVSVGDLLVTGVGSIGVPYLVKDNNPLYFKDGNVIWFQNQGKIDGDYFFYAFSGSAIQNYIRDSAGIGTVGTYTIESGKKTPIWIPSEEEQKAIANVINNADQEVMLSKKELEAWQKKKKSLMQLLLTGLVRMNA